MDIDKCYIISKTKPKKKFIQLITNYSYIWRVTKWLFMHTNNLKSITIKTNITSHMQNFIQMLDVYLALHKRVPLHHNEPQESSSKEGVEKESGI